MNVRRILTQDEKEKIVSLYVDEKKTTNDISKILHLNKTKIYEVLAENNVTLRKKGELNTKVDIDAIQKYYTSVKRFVPKEGYYFIAVSKDGSFKTKDVENTSGCLSRFIKNNFDIDPLSNYRSMVYYYENNKYWYEDYFDFLEVKEKEKKIEVEEIQDTIVKLYLEDKTPIHKIAEIYKVGKKRIENILDANNVERRKKGELNTKLDKNIIDFNVPIKYVPKDGYHFIAVAKHDGKEFNDYENKGGHLYNYIKNVLNIEIPSFYETKKHFYETGNYWYEQFFDIVEVKNSETKKCPYCDWETVDLENRSGYFMFHLLREHGISIEEHLKNHPEDKDYFSKQYNIIKRNEFLEQEENYVICPICNKKFKELNASHIERVHNMPIDEFKEKYPNVKLISDTSLNKLREAQKKANLVVPHRFESKAEIELREFLTSFGIEHETNRQMLIGKEIDILIPSHKIGIEYDGVIWHTEKNGKKDKDYHLWKTDKCKEKGYDLIHIFEYEFILNKEVVKYRLKRILGNNEGLIVPSKISVREITLEELKEFNKKYGFEAVIDDYYLSVGCYDDELIFVMRFDRETFKIIDWFENYNYNVDGCRTMTIEYVINKFHPSKIELEIDRRWYYSGCENEFLSVGFKFDSVLPPICKYFNSKVDRVRLFNMEIGNYSDRIWNCGYFKYVLS